MNTKLENSPLALHSFCQSDSISFFRCQMHNRWLATPCLFVICDLPLLFIFVVIFTRSIAHSACYCLFVIILEFMLLTVPTSKFRYSRS